MLGLLRNACQHVQPPAGSGTPTDLAQLNRTLATIQSDLAALKRNQAALLGGLNEARAANKLPAIQFPLPQPKTTPTPGGGDNPKFDMEDGGAASTPFTSHLAAIRRQADAERQATATAPFTSHLAAIRRQADAERQAAATAAPRVVAAGGR
jgi:hypothetical protein